MVEMTRQVHIFTMGIVAAVALWVCFSAVAGEAADTEAWSTEYRFGGCGGVYFLASPGGLWVEIEKCDLNRTGRRTHLRAILFGPDRRVIEERTLPDDGRKKGSGPGPVQRCRLAASVPRTGIYGVNVTVSEDRYGEDIAWGFRTNCPRFLVETSRGHRDAPHEEPLVLLNPDTPGDVCFLPRHGAFSVEVTGLPEGVEALMMYDPEGREAGVMPVSENGEAAAQFRAEARPSAKPWRLHLPKFEGVVRIDGVTRWKEDDDFPNLSLWTPRPESWFAFHQHRWLLTPYSRTVYAECGAEGCVAFQVHNNSLAEKKVALSAEFPDECPWSAELSAQEVVLAPRKSAPISVRYRVPAEGDTWTCHVRATPLDDTGVSTFSTLEVRRGVAPATQPLTIPLVLKPYRHENELFGYLPEYPLANQVYFDMQNRPVVAATAGASIWRDGGWTEAASARLLDGTLAPFRLLTSKVAFDRDNGMYLIGEQGGAPALLRSRDGGTSFASHPIPGRGYFDIEQFSGHNLPAGPPPFLRFTLTKKDPKVFWRRLNDLALFLPEWGPDGALSIGEPILLSKKCIGCSMHSGIPSSIVSRGSRVHVAWGEATEPEENAPGVPTFVATYDRETGALGAPVLIGYGPPANDVHNTPCITMDSQGYLHILVGTHGRTFLYARSLKPNDAGGGWTEAEAIGPGLRQTYVGLVCDPNDTLHLVFRLWRNDTTYFPAGNYACLAYMSKDPGGPWSEPRPLIVAPFSEYSIYYHRLTIDRAGQLFLSYDYYSTFWFYRTDHWGTRRALLTSRDRGETWKLAELCDLTHLDKPGAHAVGPTTMLLGGPPGAQRLASK